ncbi:MULTISPECIES: GNAT family N-acetyltransferase [unclassified Sphingomonas]|uniref:GNAT family N-acetyltransferase n=1 Tax=unclassified Sphingomonas TaxID=196159 RepID=UPI002151778E|nr:MULTISPECIES: GNAT family N-acetyltransferase [unclassified Sphingomonas]MCR5872325.1 GNAT family N-acetyltransferase [Sphingomonas sp. J344]UUX99380.1 GNAT family N-acetyltransferase [Sphingomonas sp. J315]
MAELSFQVQVRRAVERDYPVWAEMLAALHPGQSPEAFLAEIGELLALPEPYVAFLAFDDAGQALGMIDARLRNYAEGAPRFHAAYVEDLWVSPDARGRGVASALLAAVEDWAREQGADWLGSDTSPDNDASRAWHKAAGFAEVEQLVVFGKPLG